MAGRRHGQSITVWLTPADVKAFDRRARESAQSRTEALRGLVRGFIAGTNVAPQLYAELGLLREELRRIGVNLNQAQRLANAYRRPTRAVRDHTLVTARAVAKLIAVVRCIEGTA